MCRQREICPPVDVMVAGYLGWQRPSREVPVVIDHDEEEAAFAAVMRDFAGSAPTSFNISDVMGER